MKAIGLPLVVVVACALPAAVTGQVRQLDRGSFVRVSSPAIDGGGATGTLMSQRSDSLELVTEGLARHTIATSSIQSLEVRAGRPKTYALIGMVVTGLTARTIASNPGDGRSLVERDFVALGGALSGAMIGSFFKREKWVRVFP